LNRLKKSYFKHFETAEIIPEAEEKEELTTQNDDGFESQISLRKNETLNKKKKISDTRSFQEE